MDNLLKDNLLMDNGRPLSIFYLGTYGAIGSLYLLADFPPNCPFLEVFGGKFMAF